MSGVFAVQPVVVAIIVVVAAALFCFCFVFFGGREGGRNQQKECCVSVIQIAGAAR